MITIMKAILKFVVLMLKYQSLPSTISNIKESWEEVVSTYDQLFGTEDEE